MIYANPIGQDFASGEFYDRLSAPFYLSPEKLESDYAPVRFDREFKIFRKFCTRGSVLDVGCSTGAFLHHLRRRFPGDYETTGTDVAAGALDHAESRGTPVIRASFPEWNPGARRFDAVTFWAVIEHLAHPRAFLQKAASVLQPGGYCFILVPNMESLAVRLLGSKYRYIMPDHLNYFTARTLDACIRDATDLRPVRITSTHFNPVVIWKDFRSQADRVPDSERARLLARTTAWKQNPVFKPLHWGYFAVEQTLARCRLADNLVMVARKPY